MSLKDLVKQRIIKYIIKDAQSKMKKKYTAIICDDKTIQILHHLFRMHQLNDLDVGVVLNVKYPRQRLKISPIYYLSCDYESTKYMCADYKNPKETLYAAPVHVYYNSKVSKRIKHMIHNANIRKYMKTFCEVHTDFLVLEQRVFSLCGGYESFHNLYINEEHHADELALRAQQLIGLCTALEAEPYIRYSANSTDAKTLAQLFHQKFCDTTATLTEWQPNVTEYDTTLIIFDRKDDPLTPLLHHLSFTSIVHDLLAHDTCSSVPDENDEIWVKYRYTFIGDVVQQIPRHFQQWKQANLLQVRGYPRRDIHPLQLELVKQYTTNINMAKRIMDIWKNNGLLDIVDLEQDIVTGIDENGRKIDRTKTQQKVCEIMMDDNKENALKLRVIMLYFLCQRNITPDLEQMKILLKISGIVDNVLDTVCSLSCLGVDVSSGKYDISCGHKQYWKEVIKHAKATAETTLITRFMSYLEWALREQLSDSLSDEAFEWIQRAPKNPRLGPTRHTYRRRNRNYSNKGLKQRYIIFVLGGVSYSEISSCYELSNINNVDIFIGSTLIYSPQQYIECFKIATKDHIMRKNMITIIMYCIRNVSLNKIIPQEIINMISGFVFLSCVCDI